MNRAILESAITIDSLLNASMHITQLISAAGQKTFANINIIYELDGLASLPC
jgi:hypothetical protein